MTLFLIKVVGHAVESEDSHLSRSIFACSISLISLGSWFLVIRSIQRHKTNPSNFSPLMSFLGRSWVEHILWMCLGMLILILTQWGIFAASSISNRSKQKQLSEKGFLDFKLQAETAMADISPAINPITAITSQVGDAMARLAQKVSAVTAKSTGNQLRVTKSGAVKLDKYSRRLDSKCLRLEQIGSSLQEGLLGWYTWAHKQEASRIALSEATPSLRRLCQSMTLGIQGTDSYIATLKTMKGVSRDMNAALERHIQVIKKNPQCQYQYLRCVRCCS